MRSAGRRTPHARARVLLDPPSSIFHPHSDLLASISYLLCSISHSLACGQSTPSRYSSRVQLYDHPTFRMACQQFDSVADRLQIPDAARDRLKYPKRSLSVALPIRLDDGSIQVFTGYRVQHHLTL